MACAHRHLTPPPLLPRQADGELSAPEFVQFVGRVADVRVPADRRGATPFEETLDAWLGLQLVPACRKAVQARGGRWHTEA